MGSRSDGPSPARHLVHDGKDLVLMIAVGVLMIAGFGTWMWGEAAGLLAQGGLPHVSPSGSLSIVLRLPGHLSDPRSAWPTDVAAVLPGPAWFYGAGCLLLVASAGLTVVGLRLWGRFKRRDDGFATRKELTVHLAASAVIKRGPVVRPSLKKTPFGLTDVGLPLGDSVPDKLKLAVSTEDSVVVIAAPRQGKSSQVVIPWVHRWPGPALVTSMRMDVLLATAALRSEQGLVAVMAPTGMTSWPSMVRWSPTSGCKNLDKARERAEVMVTVGRSEKQDSSNAGYFGANATNLLTLWLHAAALAGRSMLDVLAWSLNDRDDTPVKLLRDHPAAAPGSAQLLDGLYRTPPETKSGLWTTVQTALAPLLSPTAQATFCPETESDGFDLEAFLRAKGTIYLLVERKQASALAPLIAVFVDELIETAKRIADTMPGGRLDPPLALFLDEIANVVPLPSLPDLMSFAGGSGIFIAAILQSRAQAEARWGAEQAAMLWGAATVKLILGGLSGNELRDLSENLVGEYDRHMTSYQRSDDGSITTGTSIQQHKTMTAEDIRTLSSADREALVIHATTPAVKIRMTRHYEGPDAALYANAERAAYTVLAEHSAPVMKEEIP
ncbi:type IV secretory system conjugative DNA transfer family protein [Catenulispora sp. NL8]|uniref:Type IV secretory system conjugative DNA transfer family protein n=1 Tax=Catenulispora pinistramenti TaxID=2705254 RepID=A0ABS5KLK3_9ACTN|nr:type IV secretory system conjugative DNA transfer family protein [Catenulispora pinistramenti]MBS2546914.1 type IV secretory system conjugative DNA transfer family protein [Catenulispora pinistramenti]